jgi:ABC-2 type transport system ATP-binding protein
MNDIEIRDFQKSYGDIPAVKGVSLDVKKGELFGLIGPDGAGKTTLIRAICTLLSPDSGTIQVRGRDVIRHVPETRAVLGYMPQRFSLYQDLTVEQNLQFFADLFRVPKVERAKRLETLYKFSRLGPFKKRQAGALSGGMKQKLALSCALIHTPEVLILDEPTFGVDPVSRQEFWEILREIRQEGTTILVSTAYMDEADQCDRVALFFEGEVKGTGSPEELRKLFRFPLFRLEGTNLQELRRFFNELPSVHTTQLFGDALHVAFQQMPSESDWQQWQEQAGQNLSGWKTQQPSIEDVFLDMIGSKDE